MSRSPLAPEWLAVPTDSAALDQKIWPSTARRDKSGCLTVGGVSARDLVEQFGTPAYVVDEADFRSRARLVRDVFEREFARVRTAAHVYYAGKAFLCGAVVEWIDDEGLSLDVASGGEFAVALAGGIAPSRIGFHGNNKSEGEIDRAVAAGVGAIIIDNAEEVGRVAAAAARHNRVQGVRLRVNSGVHAHTHDFLATAHEDQKFGVPLEAAHAIVAAIRSHPELHFYGLHCHIGSQIFDADGFAESASRLLRTHAELVALGEVAELNLGGGFGIAYTPADDPKPIEIIAAKIADAVASECEALGIPVPAIAFEPGRFISGPAGVTLYSVGTTKDVAVSGDDGTVSAVRRYVSVDGGMSDNARPSLYGADYTVRLAGRVSQAEQVLVRIAGKHCESGDIVVNADYLPGDVARGDVLAVAATGAYCWSLSSNYNFLTRPPVVAVRDGRARVIVRGETEADLLARAVVPGEETA